VTYTDRAGKPQGNETVLPFSVKKTTSSEDYYSSFAVRKAVLLQRYVYATQQFLIAHHESKETEGSKERLRKYSEIFTQEAASLEDEDLIKAAKECAEFVKTHCDVAQQKRRQLFMGRG